MEYNFTVQNGDSGKRIDLFLTSKIKEGCSRSFIQRLIIAKVVLLNNAPVKSHHKLSAGEVIQVKIPDIKKSEILPEEINFEIIYEDDHILVINKPSGLVVHPAAGNSSGTLVNALSNYTKNLSDINPERPGIVHRLDKETSGVMVVARNNSAHLNLVKQFAKHKVKKKYIAIVKGILEFDEGVIDLPIGRHSRDFRLLKITFSKGARDAITRYKVLKRFKDSTLLELRPETGRTHQLRVHLAHLGHPILGDAKYGRLQDFPRLALHAKELEFVHPATNKRVTFSADLPEEFE